MGLPGNSDPSFSPLNVVNISSISSETFSSFLNPTAVSDLFEGLPLLFLGLETTAYYIIHSNTGAYGWLRANDPSEP